MHAEKLVAADSAYPQGASAGCPKKIRTFSRYTPGPTNVQSVMLLIGVMQSKDPPLSSFDPD